MDIKKCIDKVNRYKQLISQYHELTEAIEAMEGSGEINLQVVLDENQRLTDKEIEGITHLDHPPKKYEARLSSDLGMKFESDSIKRGLLIDMKSKKTETEKILTKFGEEK